MHKKGDFSQDHVIVQILLVAIRQQHRENVSRCVVFLTLARADLREEILASLHGGLKELRVEGGQRLGDLSPNLGLVTRGMKKRGALTEFPREAHQCIGLLR